jgi:acetoin utilization deacetylase AcuC-like enzyme
LDEDTVLSKDSYAVSLLAVSAWLDGLEMVLSSGEPAFVLARPPGHHAQRAQGQGFCIFNNEAIAATAALDEPDVHRVAILDWDVHHGNGTQTLVQDNPHVAYCSLHQSPLFPGTGTPTEHGRYNNVLNLIVFPGSTLADYEPLLEYKVLPFLTSFRPDLLIVSAGYDAIAADPLADICLQPEDYGLFSQYCLQVTRRILFGLEGGYDLEALPRAVAATIQPCLV